MHHPKPEEIIPNPACFFSSYSIPTPKYDKKERERFLFSFILKMDYVSIVQICKSWGCSRKRKLTDLILRRINEREKKKERTDLFASLNPRKEVYLCISKAHQCLQHV